MSAGIPVRHTELGLDCSFYKTNIPCESAGIFNAYNYVSMRPMKPIDAFRAAEITARYSKVHGAPIHIGNPAALGIADINKPDVGDPVPIYPGEEPVFW